MQMLTANIQTAATSKLNSRPYCLRPRIRFMPMGSPGATTRTKPAIPQLGQNGFRTNAAAVAFAFCAATLNLAHGQTQLNGSSTHLPVYSVPDVGIGAIYTGGTGTWVGTNAVSDWQGAFSFTGPRPTSGNPISPTTSYNFTTLPLGGLPVGTYFYLGDLDQSEVFTLRAFDAGHKVITTAWLESDLGGHGTGSGPGSTVVLTDMPGYDWNVTSAATYTFTGSNNNTNFAVALGSTQQIGYLDFTRDSTNAAFAVGAPAAAPEPSSLLLMIGSGAMLLLRRRRVSSL